MGHVRYVQFMAVQSKVPGGFGEIVDKLEDFWIRQLKFHIFETLEMNYRKTKIQISTISCRIFTIFQTSV